MKLFKKEVCNCQECPNISLDEEEHLDFYEITHNTCPPVHMGIPNDCPLEDL